MVYHYFVYLKKLKTSSRRILKYGDKWQVLNHSRFPVRAQASGRAFYPLWDQLNILSRSLACILRFNCQWYHLLPGIFTTIHPRGTVGRKGFPVCSTYLPLGGFTRLGRYFAKTTRLFCQNTPLNHTKGVREGNIDSGELERRPCLVNYCNIWSRIFRVSLKTVAHVVSNGTGLQKV